MPHPRTTDGQDTASMQRSAWGQRYATVKITNARAAARYTGHMLATHAMLTTTHATGNGQAWVESQGMPTGGRMTAECVELDPRACHALLTSGWQAAGLS